jgi:4-hydroxy-3-methylbut-2-enyl diphosphate reductase
MISKETIEHYDLHLKKLKKTENYLSFVKDKPLKIAITAGASCPDSMVEAVMLKIRNYVLD